MTTLNIIEELLNIEIGDKVLRNGRIYNEKNRYYWYRNEYYIVNIVVVVIKNYYYYYY